MQAGDSFPTLLVHVLGDVPTDARFRTFDFYLTDSFAVANVIITFG
jgi:hypothetical protein